MKNPCDTCRKECSKKKRYANSELNRMLKNALVSGGMGNILKVMDDSKYKF